MTKIQNVVGSPFRLEDLRANSRKPGISAFMRVRNGEDFLAETVRSHLPFYDEIVIVFNQCEDNTESIVARLLEAYPEKIRAFHYLDRVLPLGHPDYDGMPFDEVVSMANYSNFALAQTRFSVATKLDDDHVALPRNLGALIAQIRQTGYALDDTMLCFSGLNLVRTSEGIGLLKPDPYSGGGDIGYFQVTNRTYFANSVKHEVFQKRHLKRKYGGLTYLHGKYLKRGEGFANYELDRLPNSRFARKKAHFEKHCEAVDLQTLVAREALPSSLRGWMNWLPDKLVLRWDRRCRLSGDVEGLNLEEAFHCRNWQPESIDAC